MATLEGVAREELTLSFKHGTDYGYTTKKCRCSECREAHRLKVQALRDRNRAPKRLPEINHGTEWAYRKRLCRCVVCVRAQKKRVKDKYRQKLAKLGKAKPFPGSKITQEQLDRAFYHLQDGCSYAEAARTVGMGQDTLMRYYPGYKGQGRLNMVEINSTPELKKLHDEIWNMKLPGD